MFVIVIIHNIALIHTNEAADTASNSIYNSYYVFKLMPGDLIKQNY